MNEELDRLTVLMEAVLRKWDGLGTDSAARLCPDDASELIGICAEGVASFEAASAGVSPVQKAMVGVQYTINALREWREQGAGFSSVERGGKQL